MTRRRDVDGGRRRRRCACWPSASRPVCTIVGKTWGAAPREGRPRRPRGEPRDDRRVDRVPRRRRASACIYDAEHFFDGCARRPRLRAALPARRRRRRAPSASSCATRTARRCPAQIAEATRRRVRRAAGRRASASTATTTAACGVANSLAAVEAGATQVQGTMNGIGERTGNANLVTIIANLQLKLGTRCSPPEQLARLTRDRALRRRAAEPRAEPEPAVRRHATPSPTRAGCTSPASARTRRRSSTSTRRSSATAASCSSPSSPAAARSLEKAEAAGIERRRPDGARASLERVKELEHDGYQFEAADGSFELLHAQGDRRLRAAVPARVLARDRRAARRRQGRDRGDDQDLGRRRALRAHRRGQRPGQRARRARCARRSIEIHPHLRDIELVNFKVRILDETKGTGAITRVLIDASDGAGRLGLDRRARERHRRLVAGARRLARVRRCSRAGRAAVAATRSAPARVTDGSAIPLARPVLGEAEEQAVLEVLRSGQLSLGPRVPEFEQALRRAPRRAARERRVERHRRPAPRAARGRRRRRRRGRHVAVLVRRERERRRLRARPAGLRRHRPA